MLSVYTGVMSQNKKARNMPKRLLSSLLLAVTMIMQLMTHAQMAVAHDQAQLKVREIYIAFPELRSQALTQILCNSDGEVIDSSRAKSSKCDDCSTANDHMANHEFQLDFRGVETQARRINSPKSYHRYFAKWLRPQTQAPPKS